jgi:Glycosyl hydrolase family 46
VGAWTGRPGDRGAVCHLAGGASDIADQRLGQPFLAAWAAAANRDPVFRKVQRDLRDSMYWSPALTAATADGVGLLGLADSGGCGGSAAWGTITPRSSGRVLELDSAPRGA